MSSDSTESVTNIEVSTGISMFTREPFCTIFIDGKPRGQMSPNELRTMALHWLEAAEAAESDAIVFAELTDSNGFDLPINAASGFIAALRKRRDLT